MKHFIIITNRPKDPDLEITRRVQELLKLRQASCSVYADEIPKEEWKRILLREGDRTDAILVLGGDGTMLRAARDTADSQIPMLGINLGTLGYLTEVEKRAFYELVADSKVKAKNIYIVDKPVADAIGAGLDVTKSRGIMIVNIGAETTEISVLSLGGIVISKSVKIGGNKLDDSIISNVRKVYNLVIGSKTAEGLKKELGSAVKAEEHFAPGFGRNVLSGLPVSVDISSDVIYQAIVDPLHSIMDSIKVILERTPPELAADIIKNGIYVSGGTSNINNLEKFINQETNLSVNIVENPSESVVRGLMGVVTNPDFAGVAYTPQDKTYD